MFRWEARHGLPVPRVPGPGSLGFSDHYLVLQNESPFNVALSGLEMTLSRRLGVGHSKMG